jgi:hypothetical protein
MKITTLLTFYTLFFTACNLENTSGTFDQVYDFVETKDMTYCNPDSILGGDCGGGNFYFTNKGYVFYTFSCYGSDSTSFEIGTYKVEDNEVVCTFDKNYSFFNGFNDENESLIYDPNNGILKDSNKWAVLLQKISCDNYDFGFKLQDGSKFSVSKTDIDNSRIFKKELAKINKLIGLW